MTTQQPTTPPTRDAQSLALEQIFSRIIKDQAARLVVRDANNIIVYTIQMEEVR